MEAERSPRSRHDLVAEWHLRADAIARSIFLRHGSAHHQCRMGCCNSANRRSASRKSHLALGAFPCAYVLAAHHQSRVEWIWSWAGNHLALGRYGASDGTLACRGCDRCSEDVISQSNFLHDSRLYLLRVLGPCHTMVPQHFAQTGSNRRCNALDQDAICRSTLSHSFRAHIDICSSGLDHVSFACVVQHDVWNLFLRRYMRGRIFNHRTGLSAIASDGIFARRDHRRALPRHRQDDLGIWNCLLGIHRLQSIHVDLVWKSSRRNSVVPCSPSW